MPRAASEKGPETITFSRYSSLGNSVVIDVRDSNRLWKNYHDTYTLCIVDKNHRSSSVNKYRSKNHVAGPGDILFFEPGEYHATEKINGFGTFKVIMLNNATVASALQDLHFKSAPHFGLFSTKDNELFSLMSKLLQTVDGGTTHLEIESCFTRSLEMIFGKFTEGKAEEKNDFSKRKVERVREYLFHHYNEHSSLDRLSAVSGLSKFHLVRAFKKYYGLTPHAFQLQLSILDAKKSIEDDRPIDLSCFTDQSHFIKKYKQIWGITPGHYASMMKGKVLLSADRLL